MRSGFRVKIVLVSAALATVPGFEVTAEPGAMASNAPPTNAELERRQSPWRILLMLVALALVAETFMATRGWRAVARRVRPVAPAGSAVPASTSDRSSS